MYEVSYSERVIEHLREMVLRNPRRANAIRAAFREFNRRFRIYPLFGQPLRDLSVPRAQLWIATIPPLVVEYVLVEADDTGHGRQVMVVQPFRPLLHFDIV